MIARARSPVRGSVKRTPVVSSTTISERVGGRVVLKAENLQSTGSFKIRGALAKLAELGHGAAPGRRGRQRRQPRPGGRLRGPPLSGCRARSSCRTAPRSPRPRRPGPTARRSCRAARRSTSRWPRRRPGPPRPGWPSSTPSTTRPSSPGRPRSASSWSRTSPELRARHRAGRRRRAGERGRHRGQASRSRHHGRRRAGRRAALPYANQPVAERPDHDAGRRHRRQAARADHRARWSSGGSTTSSPSTRTTSPTP